MCIVSAVQAIGEKGVKAKAEIVPCDLTDTEISGRAILRERPSDQGVREVDVAIFARGLPDGDHAFHIHETANCEPCAAAGGHFDPGPNSNPSPDGNHPFHLGDLINLEVNNGFGVPQAITTRVTLSEGPISIFDEDGSTFIIHVDPDTFCPDGPVDGCAGGARLACGIIEPVQSRKGGNGRPRR